MKNTYESNVQEEEIEMGEFSQKSEEEKKHSVDSLIEKGKKGKLSVADID